MPRKIAVVSDAVSPGFWFPTWYRYYSGLFGSRSLYLLTYEGNDASFSGFDLGSVVRLPTRYSDRARATAVSYLVNSLLAHYDVVIRCDIDEILFPDLRVYPDLKAYAEEVDLPCVTAIGFDVVQQDGEGPIRPDEPILAVQRRVGIVFSPLHKTAMTSIPLEWCAGFHGCTAPPRFHRLFMAHLKLADFDGRLAWHDLMLRSSVAGGSEESYYSDARPHLDNLRNPGLGRPRVSGWAGLTPSHDLERYSLSVGKRALRDGVDFYMGAFELAENACVLPGELARVV